MDQMLFNNNYIIDQWLIIAIIFNNFKYYFVYILKMIELNRL